MTTKQISDGVLRALKAYKVEIGMTDADAATWAYAHLVDGIAQFNAAFSQHQDALLSTEEALIALRTWAQAT